MTDDELLNALARSVLYHGNGETSDLPEYAANRIRELIRERERCVPDGKYRVGDRVRKHSGSWWEGKVVGTYSTRQTPEGYNVQMDMVPDGPVQIYPEAALEPAPHWPRTDEWTRDEDRP